MKYVSTGICALFAVLLLGCSYPEAAVLEQADSRPAIGVSNAPAGTMLYVDGLAMGAATNYNGVDQVLLIESGKHLIEVKAADGTLLLSETVFLGNTTTKIFKLQP